MSHVKVYNLEQSGIEKEQNLENINCRVNDWHGITVYLGGNAALDVGTKGAGVANFEGVGSKNLR